MSGRSLTERSIKECGIRTLRIIFYEYETMTEKPIDQEFLEYLIKSIVAYPDEVVVGRKVDEMGVLLTLKVNREDMGKIIGREGSTAKAIRSLVRIVGLKHNARVNLKIEEPEGSTREPYSSRSADIDDLGL